MKDFPGYTILEQIDETLQSVVYRARKEGEPGTVIIKALKTRYPSPSDVARIKHEYNIIHSLPIEGVVRTLDIFHSKDSIALILEDFGGVSLKEVLKEGSLSIERFLDLAVGLSEILGNIHQRNITHRDIKPLNILLNREDGTIKITDFGIATEIKEIYDPGVMEGTLAYISPEQTGRMNCTVDYRTDLYSLGITFYEMLIGQVPFISKDPLEIIHSHIAKAPVPPDQLNTQVPPPLSDIVMRLMAKAVEDRYQNAFGLMADLKVCLDQLRMTGRIEPFELGRLDHSLRFIVPQMIVGRDKELKILFEAFDRVNHGGEEIILVAGEPGIGKSTLVNEIHKPIVEKRGYFISGKYEQFQRYIPYSAIIQAFQVLARQLLTESEERVQLWKEQLLWVLGPNGKIITNALPEIELIIANAQTRLDKAKAHNTMVIMYTNTSSPREAIQLGLKALKYFGIHMAIDVGRAPVILELIKVRLRLKKITPEKIVDLPRMEDPDLLVIHDLTLNIGTPAYYVNPNLFALVTLKGVNSIMRYGHTPHSAVSFMALATIIETVLGDYELAFRIGEMALKLSEKLDNRKIAGRVHHTFALVMMDIDNFKKVNDTCGHQLGDEVLRNVARTIKKISRAVDVAARYGGEEFVLILPKTDQWGAMTAAEKIRKSVEEMEIPHDMKMLHVTISMGVAVFPTQASDKDGLIKSADEALYVAKRKGKNCVSLGAKQDNN